MSNQYDTKYLKTTLTIIKDNLQDLLAWSDHNDDVYLHEAVDLYTCIKKIEAREAEAKENNDLLEQGLHNDFIPEV